MSQTSFSVTRAQNQLPASILFKPRDLKQYCRWQNLCTTLKPAQQGFLPTAAEYDDFKQWRRKQDSGYFSDVFEDISEHIKATTSNTSDSATTLPLASLCQHPIHPAAGDQHLSRCPACLIEMHLAYTRLLRQRLQDAVGRPLPQTGTPSELQESLYGAWSKGKVAALKQVGELERIAAKEDDWKAQKKEIPQGDYRSAHDALDLYWFETSGYNMFDVRNTKEKSKKVVFSEGTDFSHGRRSELYWRKSPRYEPGRYAVQDEQHEENCGISDDSEDYSQNSIPADQGEDRAKALIVGWQDQEEDEDSSDWEDIDTEDEDYEDGDEDGDENDDGDSSTCTLLEEAFDLVVFTDD